MTQCHRHGVLALEVSLAILGGLVACTALVYFGSLTLTPAHAAGSSAPVDDATLVHRWRVQSPPDWQQTSYELEDVLLPDGTRCLVYPIYEYDYNSASGGSLSCDFSKETTYDSSVGE